MRKSLSWIENSDRGSSEYFSHNVSTSVRLVKTPFLQAIEWGKKQPINLDICCDRNTNDRQISKQNANGEVARRLSATGRLF